MHGTSPTHPTTHSVWQALINPTTAWDTQTLALSCIVGQLGCIVSQNEPLCKGSHAALMSHYRLTATTPSAIPLHHTTHYHSIPLTTPRVPPCCHAGNTVQCRLPELRLSGSHDMHSMHSPAWPRLSRERRC